MVAPRTTLRSDSVGLLSSTVVALSSTGPAYSVTATFGLLAVVVGAGTPAILLLGFVPMFLIAIAFAYLNRSEPDCGTSFTWISRALGPHLGWLTGWVIVMTDIVGMVNLAQIAAGYTLQLFGMDNPPAWLVVLVGAAWTLALTGLVVAGVEVLTRSSFVLLGIELAILLALAVTALVAVYSTHPPPGSTHVQASWFSPSAVHGGTPALLLGVQMSVLVYWGWDTALSINEETKDRSSVPGIAAVLSTVGLLVIFLFVGTALTAYAGPALLAAHVDDVLGVLGEQIFGTVLGKVLVLCVLSSAAAAIVTTIVPTTRVMLAMARAQAAPRGLAAIHPRLRTPHVATWLMGAVSTAAFAGLVLGGSDVLADTGEALGLLIAFYYGLTGIAAVVYYRAVLCTRLRLFLLAGVAPLLGGAGLLFVFGYTAWQLDSSSPDAAVHSAQRWFGVGSADVLGVGLILLGVVAMVAGRRRWSAFFAQRPRRFHHPTVAATFPPE